MSLSVNTPVIETERLVLRAPKLSDFEPFLAFMQSDRARFVRRAEIDRDTGWRAFAHVAGMWMLRGYGSFIFSARDDDHPLGMAGPWHPITWPEREIGWALWAPEAEGNGLAFEAARAARDFARETLGWDAAVSYIDPQNARSIALAERLGAVLDPAAQTPGGEPCLTYRHPMTEARD
ncbi:GNAT family N-acetyltransferase [Actibacterium sp. MT2.3-13A]|uniref:GNAT family N-acetyltransferase n=1 Tax=Actibacterium sp. MT2.3-13A TaxID=2828332 RepID=UPI001BABC35F|nr:GNAT family N-acetyltransferase [Actibacterium sp. MT2.3-13A]